MSIFLIKKNEGYWFTIASTEFGKPDRPCSVSNVTWDSEYNMISFATTFYAE